MDMKIFLVFFVGVIAVSQGFTLRDIWDYLIGGGYGQYPYQGSYQGNYPTNYPTGSGLYPSGSSNGQYPGSNYPGSNYPGSNYPGSGSNYPGAVGPPGAHPGCPLCDSSVYSYCSHKQAHDACCCENPAYLPYQCRKADCKFLYSNSCQEYQLISNCCCVDLQKNSIEPVVPVVG